jgi:hypothetical protein
MKTQFTLLVAAAMAGRHHRQLIEGMGRAG